MAEALTIARPYAEAVFKLAREKNRLAAWADMLELIEAVTQDARVQARLGDPNLPAAQLTNLFLAVGGDRLDGDGRNFVKLLVESGRIAQLSEIRALFGELKAAEEGELKARISSAFPLSDEQLKQLLQKLETKYRRKISAEVEVDPELIGGVKLEVGDQVMDASVRGALDKMAHALGR
ncbi:MAG TPA: F0F1 ATP synthase subunit delta [Burkholderiales bacterium]|nr:F0F1 ATP synthase subunit delta [Burkholderiales bacterium]